MQKALEWAMQIASVPLGKIPKRIEEIERMAKRARKKAAIMNMLLRMDEYREKAELEKRLWLRKSEEVHLERMFTYSRKIAGLRRRLTKIYLKEKAEIESALNGLALSG